MPAPVFCDPAVAVYRWPGHPEAPERVSRSRERLLAAGHDVRLPAAPAKEADALLVHTPRHIAAVKSGDYDDADTPHRPGMDAIAMVSLSGALSAAESAVGGSPAFSLMRPPGHHAARERVAGFCYFNNIAAACERLLRTKAAARIAILDIDVHHGDGTEAILMGREGIHFASLHQSPLYPGTGLRSRDNCFNYPLPPLTEEALYLKTFQKALETALDFKPELLAVSAGFDTFRDCPIAQLKLDKGTYRLLGQMIQQTRLNRFAVLEGGYADALPLLIENFLEGFFQ